MSIIVCFFRIEFINEFILNTLYILDKFLFFLDFRRDKTRSYFDNAMQKN